MKMPSRKLPYVLLLATLCVSSLVLADHDDDDEEGEHRGRGSRTAQPQATQPQWAKECSACHMLYPPALLPERSWRAMMGGLDKHFGENAALEAATRDSITEFLATNAADRTNDRRGRKMARSIGTNEVPLRITQTGYFLRKHDEIRPAVFTRPAVGSAANCKACHAGAEKGIFSEHDVRIPK